MTQPRNIRPGHVVIHPNREKPSCKLVRLIVVAILLASVALILIVTIGGWSELDGMQPVNFVLCLAYVPIALYIWRWSRGLLPIAAALAILLLIIAVVAGLGLSGTSWFDRSNTGFASTQSLFGGPGLGDNALGLVSPFLIPVEASLIVFAMVGFAQGWNVELEVPEEEARRRGIRAVHHGPQLQGT